MVLVSILSFPLPSGDVEPPGAPLLGTNMTKSNADNYEIYTWQECLDKWREIHCRCIDKILASVKDDAWTWVHMPARLAESSMKQIAAIQVMADGKDMDAQAYSFIFAKVPKGQKRLEELN